MKNILFLILLSGCSTFGILQKAASIPYNLGHLHGRQETLKELDSNKQKINELKKTLIAQLVETSLEDEKEFTVLLPGLIGMNQLLENRKALKKHLKNVESTGSDTARESED